ncbi:hypothetical protein LSH36_110g00026 [Paralvinella palmiformis]|uniref:G-protein coupled receptors family 1 profile domain-containing protein n=1 Tax=Paralvinella palmiformis TaxID=53620 RepID=A0AAD9JZS7_9ANNE|nr:hypothetical protein LSH36_110g00026 [Paralvinella palmiformis]
MDYTTAGSVTNTSNITEELPDNYSMDQVGYVFVPFLLILGVGGNLLIIKVMTSASFKTLAVSKMFIAMSLSDIVVNLLLPFNKPFVRHIIGIDIRALSSGGCKLFFWTYRFAKTTSSWLVVLITMERFVAVWLPMKAKFINTERHVYIVMALLYAMFAIFFGYWCSWADQIIDDSCVINSRPLDSVRLSGIFLLCGLILYSFAPSIFVIIFNGLIVYKLIIMRKRTRPKVSTTSSLSPIQRQSRNTGNSHSTLNSRTTVMLLSAAISFVVLVTPNAVANIVSFAKKEAIFETTDPVMVSLREIVQILEQLNHCINFILYIVYNKRFRDGVIMIFKRNK